MSSEHEQKQAKISQNQVAVREAIEFRGMIWEDTANLEMVLPEFSMDGSPNTTWRLVPCHDELPPVLAWQTLFPRVEHPCSTARSNIRHWFPSNEVSLSFIPNVLCCSTGKVLRLGGTVATSLMTGNSLQFVEVHGGFKCWLAPARPYMLEDLFGHEQGIVRAAKNVVSACIEKKETRGEGLSTREKCEPWVNCELDLDPARNSQTSMWLRVSYMYSRGYLCTTFRNKDEFLEFISFARRYLRAYD